jgi:predicted ATPase
VTQSVFRFGPFELDEARFELRRDGERLSVQPKVLKLLLHLVLQRERVVSADELLRVLWPKETVSAASIKRAVAGARKALGEDGPSALRTVRGLGYQFVLAVEQLVPASVQAAEAGEPAHEPYIGREGALSLIDETLAELLAGRARCLLMIGEPGIGKTRTMHELARRAQQAGAHAWWGRGMEVEGAPAFWAVIQLLRDGARSLPPEALEQAMGAGAADIVEAVPELKEWLPDVPDAPRIGTLSERFRFFDSLATFLRRLSEQAPLVLLLDDLQRVGEPALRLLVFLLHQLEGQRVLIVGALRPLLPREGSVGELIDALRKEPSCRSLELHGLSHSELAHYVELKIGASAPPSVIEQLHQQTAGNPLFLEQLLGSVRAAGQADGALAGELLEAAAHVQGLRGAIERHLERLDEPCRALLRSAAVLGRDFCMGVLAELTQASSEQVLAHISEAAAAGIVHAQPGRVGQYRFTHALIRDALYAQLPLAERARTHGRAGAVLEARGAAADEELLGALAEHFAQAAPAHDEGRALQYMLRAADAAMRRLAYEEAARKYERARALLELGRPDEQTRLQLLLRKGEALAHATDVDGARQGLLEALARARVCGATDVLVHAATLLVGPPESGVDLELIEALRLAKDALLPGDGRRALLGALLAKCLCYSPRTSERVSMARAALASAAALPPEQRATILQACPEALGEPDYLHERIISASELARLGHAHADQRMLLHAATLRIWYGVELGDMPGVDLALEELRALVEHTREPLYRWYMLAFRGMRAYLAGRLEEAEQFAREALQLGAAAGSMAEHTFVVQLNGLRLLQGRLNECEELARGMSSRHPQMAGWRAMLAGIEAMLGRRDRARAVLEELLADDLALLRRDSFLLSAFAPAADLCGHVGDAKLAKPLYDAILPYEDYQGNVSIGFASYGPMSRHLGVLAARLGDVERAEHHFRRALRSSEAMNSPVMVSMCCVSHARTLTHAGRKGDAERAAKLVKRARVLSDAHGLSLLSHACSTLGEKLQPVAARPAH